MREGSVQSLFAAKSAISGAMAKCRNSFEGTDEYKTLQRHLARVKEAHCARKCPKLHKHARTRACACACACACTVGQSCKQDVRAAGMRVLSHMPMSVCFCISCVRQSPRRQQTTVKKAALFAPHRPHVPLSLLKQAASLAAPRSAPIAKRRPTTLNRVDSFAAHGSVNVSSFAPHKVVHRHMHCFNTKS